VHTDNYGCGGLGNSGEKKDLFFGNCSGSTKTFRREQMKTGGYVQKEMLSKVKNRFPCYGRTIVWVLEPKKKETS